jgi:hypothetical protein
MVRTPHSPEGGEGAASWAGKAGILGKVLAWAWEEAGSVGQLQLEPQEVSELGLPDPEDSALDMSVDTKVGAVQEPSRFQVICKSGL